jgi:hypothetical protein
MKANQLVVLAEVQGHHEWKALAISRMASLQFFVGQASTTPVSAFHRRIYLAVTEDLE